MTEKPLGADLADVLSVTQQGEGDFSRVLVGYTWRWWPALRLLKKLLSKRKLGRVLFARFLVSAHLADWHPWEDYREFFMSSKSLGGGALLDESHWIDQMLWFFGKPEQVSGFVGSVSDLDITSDDCVDFLAVYKDGLRVSMHLDIFGRPHEKTIQIIGSEGVVFWDEQRNQVRFCSIDGEETVTNFSEDRNFMFQEVAKEFEKIMSGQTTTTCTWEDGLNVMKIIEAVRLSQLRKKVVPIIKDTVG